MPYLRGYRAVPEPGKELNGWWFSAGRAKQPVPRGTGSSPLAGVSRAMVGFFAGYLLSEERCYFLAPRVPECLIFATIQPVGGPEHNRLVVEPNSLLRRTFEYIRWLTHRPPRFALYVDEPVTLVRHTSMREWPRPKYRHYSRNFFIETFAWLVRSGLVGKLVEKPA